MSGHAAESARLADLAALVRKERRAATAEEAEEMARLSRVILSEHTRKTQAVTTTVDAKTKEAQMDDAFAKWVQGIRERRGNADQK